MRLVAVGAAARRGWEEVLRADDEAVVSQTPRWMDALCASSNMRDLTRLYEGQDGRRLVLPLAGRRLPPAVRPVASLPFGWSSGGLVCAADLRVDDVRAVLTDLAALRVPRVSLRPGPGRHGVWAAAAGGRAAASAQLSQRLDLDDGFDAVSSSRFSTRVRRNARKAERAGLVVETGDAGRLVAEFDALYRASVDRWAGHQHEPLALARLRARHRDPPRKFALVAEHLGSSCRVWLARRDGVPAAAIVVLRHGRHATYWRGAMDRDVAAGTGANELLHRSAIEDACASGARSYHMGTSAPGSSLAHFKAGFGAVEEPHASYRLERLPIDAVDRGARRVVKRVLRFRDP